MDNKISDNLVIEPLTPANWDKFVELFGTRGACGNCWCMAFRRKKKDFEAGKKDDGNKNAMKEIVRINRPSGILAFYEGQPVGWCAFAPREDFIRMENSRVHKRLDDEPVWSIPCLFITKNFRKKGFSVALLKKVIAYAREQKIRIIEAYPVMPTKGKLPDAFAWVGLYTAFEKAGFRIVDRTSKNRPMVRYYL